MNVQKTLVFLKPDALANTATACQIIDRIINQGFVVKSTKYTQITNAKILQHYNHLVQSYGEPMQQKIISYFGNKSIFVLSLEKENAIADMRALVGATDPAKAEKGTIRADFSSDNLTLAMSENRFVNNLIHASDSTESAELETKIWLG